MRITVTNTALLNTGDAAIMVGTEAILRRAFGEDLELSLRDQQPVEAGELYPEYSCAPLFHDQATAWLGEQWAKLGMLLLCLAALAWRTPLRAPALRLLPADLRGSLRSYVESDLIVTAGGTYLVPHYRLGPKLLELLIARLAGRPYVLFTQSLGPFSPGQRLLIWLLRGAQLILVRDRRSAAHLREIGVDETRMHRCADAAFALPEEAISPPAPQNAPHVGISVRDWPHFAKDTEAGMTRYLDAVAAVTAQLIERQGARVTFISTCQGKMAYWTDDSQVAEEVVARLPQALRAQATVDQRFHGPAELRHLLRGFDLFVSTRLHGAILALQAGVPVVPIAYEFKTIDFFHEIGLEKFLQEIETIEKERLYSASRTALAEQTALRGRIAGEVEALRASAFSAVSSLRRVMEVAA